MSSTDAKDSLKATRRRGRGGQSSQLRQARDALYREHIMAVAERLFADQGFTDTRMQDVAREAGISLGTLYQSYPGKNDLYRGILIARDTEMLETVMRKGGAMLQSFDSIEQLLWVMEINVRYLLEHPDYLRMQLQQGYAWYHSAAQASTDERMMWERGLSVMEQVFNWGVKAGVFLEGNTEDMARLLMSLQQTRLANWVAADMQEAHDQVIERIQADFVRNFCLPDVIKQRMSSDGLGLNDATRAKIRRLDQ